LTVNFNDFFKRGGATPGCTPVIYPATLGDMNLPGIAGIVGF
jgi:hypothetical protein